jgi:hypothetical protein
LKTVARERERGGGRKGGRVMGPRITVTVHTSLAE